MLVFFSIFITNLRNSFAKSFYFFAGILDEETKAKMEEPRCGMSDANLFEVKVKRRARRYVHQGTDWKLRFKNKEKVNRRCSISTIFSVGKKSIKGNSGGLVVIWLKWNSKYNTI